MKIRQRTFPGTRDPREREYERRHRALAREAAAEGMVLLKNEDQLLPLKEGTAIALYGAGAEATIKGGTGSGDVNARETVSVYQGLLDAGFRITTEKWLEEYREIYRQARRKWRDEIWEKAEKDSSGGDFAFFTAYSETPFFFPSGSMPEKTEADTAVYVLARIAGEGKDRSCSPGDYLLTEREEQEIEALCSLYAHVILVLNVGGMVDLSILDRCPGIRAVIYMHQPGMEAGHALADIISGKTVPGGKLTDSWARRYADYPNAASFSHNNGNVEQERYEEGIYVGYRYFDTFQVPVRYPFGYGLSYTDFSIKTLGIAKEKDEEDKPAVCLKVLVKNTGTRYPGRQVVQVYVSCPAGKLPKERRRLAAFQKTELLAPGESRELELRFPMEYLESYEEALPGWILEEGIYEVFVGGSLGEASPAASIHLKETAVLAKTEHICPLQEELREMQPPADADGNPERGQLSRLPSVTFEKAEFVTEGYDYEEDYKSTPLEARQFVETLTEEQLIRLATGETAGDSGSQLGSAGMYVPGSAAETSRCGEEQELAAIVLADGPAGLRLARSYQVKDGRVLPNPPGMGMENGFLCREEPREQGDTYYQYCTAFPVGTLLAQTWDPGLLERCGQAVAREMQEFGVTLWLAPGMNIHRNPLCGRNFEYFSEDPLLSGKMAAAITRGVQSEEGCGTTIKHFACNNQEDNRMGSDSIVSERTLREIYLKGFEIAVKESQPMALMTSYNLVNGVHAANSFDLCTKVARDEWGFMGMIMTDWTTTMQGDSCTASGCMRAGNDSIMPGCPRDHENIRRELKEGTLDIRDLKRSVARLVMTVWQSGCYEEE